MLADRHLVFVYGLLKRGFSLHHHLSTAEFLGEAVTAPDYLLVDCQEYPGLRHASSRSEGISVQGELFRVDSAVLSQLDVVEGVDEGLYRREPVQLAEPSIDQNVWAWFYANNWFDGELLPGRWV